MFPVSSPLEKRNRKHQKTAFFSLINSLNMKKQIGVFTVDSGLFWIGDPCYIHPDDDSKLSPPWRKSLPNQWGKDWESFVARLNQSQQDDGIQFNHDSGHAGLGVCVRTPYGDGTYPVYGKYNKDGELKRIEIDFSLD